MQNLTLENLGRTMETGGIDALMNGPVGPAVSERRVQQEMERQGMPQAPSQIQSTANNFSDILENSVEKVNQYQVEADHAIKELIAGRNKNVHETMLAIERADISLKLMMQVRNKVIDAYKEVMRMQV